MKNNASSAFLKLIKTNIHKLHTCIPAIVLDYDYKTRKASVKPKIDYLSESGEHIEYPVIYNVPVLFPSTSAAGITFPLKKDDGVLLLFSERSLETVLNTNTKTVKEDDKRRFALADAIALPGFFSFSENKKGSNKGVELTGEIVNINNGNKGAARKGDTVKLQLSGTDIQNLVLSILTTGAVTPTGVAPVPATIPVTFTNGEITEGSGSVDIGD